MPRSAVILVCEGSFKSHVLMMTTGDRWVESNHCTVTVFFFESFFAGLIIDWVILILWLQWCNYVAVCVLVASSLTGSHWTHPGSDVVQEGVKVCDGWRYPPREIEFQNWHPPSALCRNFFEFSVSFLDFLGTFFLHFESLVAGW